MDQNAPSHTQTFANHAPAQRLLLALGILTTLEAVPMHFLLQAWKPVVAWVVLALTLYSLFWIATQGRALAARPHVLSADKLLLRVGTIFAADVERATITRATPFSAEAPPPDVMSLKLITSPNVLIELTTPARVQGPLGRTQSATRLAFFAQEPEALIAQLTRDSQADARRSPQQQQ